LLAQAKAWLDSLDEILLAQGLVDA